MRNISKWPVCVIIYLYFTPSIGTTRISKAKVEITSWSNGGYVDALPSGEAAGKAYNGQCAQPRSSPFQIVIDGGSTGSRLHVYEFVKRPSSKMDGTNITAPAKTVVLRRGSSKAWTPLTAHAPLSSSTSLNPAEVANHLLHTFEYAASIIPVQYHRHTGVMYQATAGMRLLSTADQEAVYDALYEGLINASLKVDFLVDGEERRNNREIHIPFPFRLNREDVATLDGEKEGLYGAIAANYLSGRIDADLHFIAQGREKDNDGALLPPLKYFKTHDEDEPQECRNFDLQNHQHEGRPVGALDMGGSSTQLVFHPGDGDNSRSCQPNLKDSPSGRKRKKLEGSSFFSTSYLSYGVDQFRERLWDTWLRDAQEREGASSSSLAFQDRAKSYQILDNPCGFRNHHLEWQNRTFVGTGDAEECARQVRRLIPGHRLDGNDGTIGKIVGGVRHPPLRGKFYAMSLYFFTLDCLRVLSTPDAAAHAALNAAWPNPTLQELADALPAMCSRAWDSDLSELLKRDDNQPPFHQFTRAAVLPHRCVEAVYMVTLLRDGFGFDPNSRDITFAYDVDGSEVEWTLGMALFLRAEEAGEWREEGEKRQTDDDGLDEATAVRQSDTSFVQKISRLLWKLGSETSFACKRDNSRFGYSHDNRRKGSGSNFTGTGSRNGGGRGKALLEEGVGVAYFLDMYGYYSMSRRIETFRDGNEGWTDSQGVVNITRSSGKEPGKKSEDGLGDAYFLDMYGYDLRSNAQ